MALDITRNYAYIVSSLPALFIIKETTVEKHPSQQIFLVFNQVEGIVDIREEKKADNKQDTGNGLPSFGCFSKRLEELIFKTYAVVEVDKEH